MYFKDFPQFYYDFNYPDGNKLSYVKDITRNIRFRREILANISVYDEYDIQDGETPEIISEKLYGNPEYHWVIMLANDKFDYITDFPLDEVSLVKYISEKYENPYDTHHYENADGFVVDSDYPGAYPVSGDEFERRLNEDKRRIKIVSKQLLDVILKNYKELM